MKAVRIHEYGGPEVLVYEDVPTPEPGPSQALVRVEAATVNPSDVAVRENRFPTPKDPPKIIGYGRRRCGRGESARTSRPSSPATKCSSAASASAARAATPSTPSSTRPRPCPTRRRLSFVDAAALGLVFPTAYYALVTRGRAAVRRDGARAGRRRRRGLGLDTARQGARRPRDHHGGGRRGGGLRPRARRR